MDKFKNFSNDEIINAYWQFMTVLQITGNLDMDNVRAVFRDRIMSDDKETIKMQYKSIIVKFDAEYGDWSKDRFGGKAKLNHKEISIVGVNDLITVDFAELMDKDVEIEKAVNNGDIYHERSNNINY